MPILDTTSLGVTLERLTERELAGPPIPAAERRTIATWIAGRCAFKPSYNGLPAPLSAELKQARLFTGDRLSTDASTLHVLGEEACRALLRLGVNDPDVSAAIAHGAGKVKQFLDSSIRAGRAPGTFCCARCSASVWRHLTAGADMPGREAMLRAGVKHLAGQRSGDGKWKTYPFWYTVLALTDIDNSAAVRELQYAARICERAAKCTGDDVMTRRRRMIAERAVSLI